MGCSPSALGFGLQAAGCAPGNLCVVQLEQVPASPRGITGKTVLPVLG